MKKIKKLTELMKRPSFTAADARKLGVHSSLLSYYIEKKLLNRIGRGVYQNPKAELVVDFQWEDLVQTACSIPNAMICGISALDLYGLTEEIPRRHWIAVPHSTSVPERKLIKCIRTRDMETGKDKTHIGEVEVSIFDRERCIIDAFRYLGMEVAIKALRMYLDSTQGHRIDLRKLERYSRKLRINIDPYLMALTT